MVTTCTVVQICYKSILLVLTKTPGRWKTVLVVVTLLKGHRLIPGFNSLMLGGHLKLTNHWTSYDLSSPSWFLQTSITWTHTLIKHNAAVSQVIKNNRLLKQYNLTYIKSLPECVPWKMSKLSPSHLYKVQKRRRENSCTLFYKKGTVMLLNRALRVSRARKGRVSFNLYSDYLLSYQIPSECEVKQTASLTQRSLPPPPRYIMIYSTTTRCWDCKIKMHSARCRRKTCRRVSFPAPFLHPQIWLHFSFVQCIYAHTGAHTVFLSVGQDTIKSVRAGWKMKLRWVMCLSSLWPLLLCPYDITQQGGNHGKLQSQSCYSESAYCSQIICILGTHASTQRVYLISRPGGFFSATKKESI